ncbi:MAG: phosphate signaling complex protein PhoU [Thermoplasmata archaeon]
MNARPDDTPRRDMAESLDELAGRMQTMLDLSVRSLETAVQLLAAVEATAIEQVFGYDRQLYELKQNVVRTCVDLLALHAPVARDLRTITADLEIASDLDRIGRYSKDIAEVVRSLPAEERGRLGEVREIRRMSELTVAIVRTATGAYRTGSAEVARRVESDDNEVDRLHEAIFRELVGRIADGSLSASAGASLILVNRYFERIADHAVNIGSHVEYLWTGVRSR